MACHPTDLPAAQCTTPLHLEQQYRQASWKGGSPCTAITGNHAPSSKRGCMQCLGIFQSSASLSTINLDAPLCAFARMMKIRQRSKLGRRCLALAIDLHVAFLHWNPSILSYATLTPTDTSHSSGQTLNTLRVRRWNVCIHIP